MARKTVIRVKDFRWGGTKHCLFKLFSLNIYIIPFRDIYTVGKNISQLEICRGNV